MNDNILISENNSAHVQQEQPANVREQAPVLIQENILQDGGIAATVDVGSTTTLDPSTPAYVRNVGDEKHAILQFGIPKGETGAAGLDGTDGQAATIQIGSVETVESSSSANVVNVGTENAAVLNFSIPRGEQGIQGEQGYSPVAYVQQIQGGARIHIADSQTETDVDVMDGATGQAATITVGSTTTGAAGTNASVVNSGTSSAAIFDFTIPRGADGQNGQDGADGSDGFSPIATVSQTSSGATISITDSQGTTTANITNGVDGTNGTDGQAATITVGSTTTGAAGTNASVVNSGTSSAAVLDFVIPRGADGADAIVRTTTDGVRTGIYYNDGTLITYRKAEITGLNITTSWGSLYRGTNADFYAFAPYTDIDFISQPVVSVTLINEGTSGSCWMGCWENDIKIVSGKWVIPIGALTFVRPSSASNISLNLYIIAIGKWK